MSFKTHWQTGKYEDGTVVHHYHVAPLQIGAVVTEKDKFSLIVVSEGMVLDDKTFDSLEAAKSHAEKHWLPVVRRHAPHYLAESA